MMANYGTQANGLTVTVFAVCMVLTSAQDPCTSYINTYNAKRNPFFTIDYSNMLCDNAISTAQWIAFYGPDEQSFGYKIPETCIMPNHCGTKLPIWVNGIHPNASFPGPIELQACHSSYTEFDCCGWNARIQVKWCSPGFYVYKLQQPERCYSSYCFTNVNIPPPPPYPVVLNPVLRDPYISEFKPVIWSFIKTDGTFGRYTFNATKFSIGCSVQFDFMQGNLTVFGSPVIEVDLVVVEGVNISSVLKQPFKLTSLIPTEFSIGEQYIAGNLDKPIMCSVKSYWSDHPEFPSPTLYSKQIKLEFQIKTNPPRHVAEDRIIILDEKDSLELWLEPNFPVTFGQCFDQSVWPTCKPYKFPVHSFIGYSVDCALNVYPDIEFPSEVAHRKSIIYISAEKTLRARSSPFSVEIDFLPIALFPSANSIFNYSYQIPSIYITIVDTQQRPVCLSYTDPHIWPFHTEPILNYDMLTQIGDFYLVKLINSNRLFEIQVQHRNCLSVGAALASWVMCNCGVFIREGSNVIGINNCGNSLFLPRIVHYQTVTSDSVGFKLPAPLLEERGTDLWHITLLSGIEVSVSSLFGNLEVAVIGLAHEDYAGLCSPGTNASTAEQYRVPDNDSLFSHIAECVDENISFSTCYCERNDTTTNTVLEVCKTTVPVTTLTVQTQCNRNVTVDEERDPYSILVPADIILSPIPPGISTIPINDKWPTPTTGITQQQALLKCQSVFRKSSAYSQCAQYASDLLSSCLTDIQVTETLDIADVYLSQFNIKCQYAVESSIVENADGTSVNGTDKLLQEIKSVLCPADCTYKNEVRGTCVNGTCHCYNNGFKGMDCSIKVGDPPKIIDFYQNVIDYTSGNSTTKDGVLILIAAENVDYVNVADLTCRFTITTKIGPDSQTIQKTYPGVRLLGGLVACFIKPNKSFTGALYHVNVSLSNDGVTYSNEKSIVVHDGNCTQCTNSSDCFIKEGKCTVEGVCSQNPGRIGDCGQTVETTTEDTPTTADPIPCQYLNYDNQHSWYGNPKQGITTLDECMRVCCDDSKCVGLDFDTKAPAGSVACWFHTDLGMIDSSREPYQGVMQRVKLSCRYCDIVSWTLYPNKNSFGAEKQNGITSLAACKDFCACKKNCQGLDYDRNKNDCWIHTNSEAIKTKYDNNDVDQYVVICSNTSGNCYRWEILEKTQSIGALLYQDYQTLDSCLQHCQDLDDCVGADISTGSSTISCWLHRSKNDADNTRRSSTSVNQYVLRRCKSDSCVTLWMPYLGFQSYGGSQINGVNTSDACKTACQGLSNCVAVDFDLSSNSCWWQSDPSSVTNNRVSNSLVNQYRLFRSHNCKDTVTWENHPGKQSYGAQRADGVTTLDDCKNVCRDDQTCVAVEYDHSNSPAECWVHRNINNIINKYDNSNIDQYVFKRT